MKKIYLYIAFISILEVLAQYLLKFGITSYLYAFSGVIMYAFLAIIYYYILKSKINIGIANALWNSCSNILVPLIDYIVFNTKLTLKQCLGLLITTIGIMLL